MMVGPDGKLFLEPGEELHKLNELIGAEVSASSTGQLFWACVGFITALLLVVLHRLLDFIA